MRLFLRWWVGQLADLVPRSVLAFFRRPPNAGGISVALRRKGKVEKVADVAESLPRRGHLPPLVLLTPPESWLLRKTVLVPIAALANLTRLLAYEMARETPFSPGEVYWDYAVRRLIPGETRIEVELVLAPRERVAGLAASCRAARLEPAAIEIPFADGNWRHLALAEGETAMARDRSLPTLAAAATALAILAVAIPFFRQSQALTAAEARLAAATASAAEAAGLRQKIDRLTQTAELIAAERTRVGDPLHALAEATRAVPDDTYLITFTLQDSRVAIGGYSPDAARLIERLARSSAFTDPAFTGPVVRGAGSNLETFSIGATLAPMQNP
jgi:general secretion pathway protein L